MSKDCASTRVKFHKGLRVKSFTGKTFRNIPPNLLMGDYALIFLVVLVPQMTSS